MKIKTFALTAAIALSTVVISGCANSDYNKNKYQIKLLQEDVDILKSKVEVLQEDQNSNASAEVPGTTDQALIPGSDSVHQEGHEIVEDDVSVTIIGKYSVEKNTKSGEEFDRVYLPVQIRNNTAKDIQGLEGVINISSKLGRNVVDIKYKLSDNPIKSGEFIIDNEIYLEINRLIDSHAYLFKSNHEDLIFTYRANKILFADGTVVEEV